MPVCSMIKSIEWVAGLFEGEGNFAIIRCGKDKKYKYLKLSVTMVDEDVIRTLLDSVEIGKVNTYHTPSGKQKGHQPIWRWEVTGTRAEVLALALAPHLHSRRKAKLSELLAEIWSTRLESMFDE